MTAPEPSQVDPEALFEEALLDLARSLVGGQAGTVIIRHFGLDIAVFQSTTPTTRALFIEAKSYNGQRQGGVGLGNGRGEGPQVDLLLNDAPQLLRFDGMIRWAFVDATKAIGKPRFALLNCTEAKAVVMGRVSRGKQNNFSMASVGLRSVTWPVFCEQLAHFLRYGG